MQAKLTIDDVTEIFQKLGGEFYVQPSMMAEKMKRIKAFVFDWDGVFNNGQKTASGGSPFSEVDSMGVNLLRYSYYASEGRLPVTLIISGEKNESAYFFSERENFKYCFYKVAHKLKALEFLCAQEGLQADEVAYFFDDVLDIPIARRCGIRILVNQRSNGLFLEYCKRHDLIDYLTSSEGGRFAVREAAEMLIGITGNYDDVITGRTENSDLYQSYIKERRLTTPQFFTLGEKGIENIRP
jgi:3-deoxy-D-manno-octulosonate 8-phosphate phosphatase (KDO 8-P phosphatase)